MPVTRRDFARALSLGAALSPLSLQAAGQNSQPASGRRLGYCIVGLGRISMGHFMPACKMSQKSKVVALVSGSPRKAMEMAQQYGVPAKNLYNYQNYDQIAENKDIDAVYIALPNSMHAEYTIRAANAGKHVLCEKPMATTVKDSQNMINACRAANVKLMIAYRCQYEPTNSRAVKMIRDGQLGTIQAIESANGFKEHAGEWRLDKKMSGGGPLPDVGIYSLNACRYLTGENPTEVKGYCSVVDRNGLFTSVEENDSWAMKFPSGVVAACSTTYGANMTGYFRVYGSKGTLTMQPAFAYQGLRLMADLEGNQYIDYSNPERDPYQFVLEADYFADCVFNNQEPKTNGEEGLRDMQYMADIYKSCGRTLG
jgi:predicted dehydrogenase